jgi:hypothetical protein
MSQHDYPGLLTRFFPVSENLFPVIAIRSCRTPDLSTHGYYNLYNKKYQGFRRRQLLPNHAKIGKTVDRRAGKRNASRLSGENRPMIVICPPWIYPEGCVILNRKFQTRVET